MGCGGRLDRRCPACNTQAPGEAHFCMNCGAALDETPAPAPAPPSPPPEERRQVTVLFADLSGYTAFAERMDPEAVKSLVDRALLRLGREVERYGGTVDKYIGDNVMALFGAPVAHEDDAERAVRAGLGMQAAMEEVNAGPSRARSTSTCAWASTPARCSPAPSARPTQSWETRSTSPRGCRAPPAPAASPSASARCGPPRQRSATSASSRSS